MMHVLNRPLDIGMSSSSFSLAERRKLAPSPEKLDLLTATDSLHSNVLQRLQDENAKLPPQVCISYFFFNLFYSARVNRTPRNTCWLTWKDNTHF